MTDTPKTIAEMREAAAKVAWEAWHWPESEGSPVPTMEAIRAIPLPSDDEMVERLIEVASDCAAFGAQAVGPHPHPETILLVRREAERRARAAIAAMRGE